MTNLSPAAQAVLDAVLQKSNLSPTVPVAAAALRAAADQVVPETSKPDDTFCCPPVSTIVWNALMDARQQLLNIAAELENQ